MWLWWGSQQCHLCTSSEGENLFSFANFELKISPKSFSVFALSALVCCS
jgi:hypothetical protein